MMRSIPVVAAAALFLMSGGPALACTCVPSKGIQADMADATAVFEGTVLGVRQGGTGSGVAEVRFRAVRYWKGDPSPEPVVLTSTRMCGLEFRVGERWLVLGRGRPAGHRALQRKPARQRHGRGPLDDAIRKELGPPAWERPEDRR